MRLYKKTAVLFLMIISICFISCSTTIPYSAKFNNQKAYLFGRFYMEESYATTLVGITLLNLKTEKEYNIEFHDVKSKNVLAIAVDPGEYKIIEYYLISHGGEGRIGTKPFPNDEPFTRFAKSFNVKEGALYYIGDYTGFSKQGRMFGLHTLFGSIELLWNLKGIVDNYDETTKEFKKLYINLKDIKTESVF